MLVRTDICRYFKDTYITLDMLGIARDWIRRIDNKQSRVSAESGASPYTSPSIDLSSYRTIRFDISERRGKENGRGRS